MFFPELLVNNGFGCSKIKYHHYVLACLFDVPLLAMGCSFIGM